MRDERTGRLERRDERNRLVEAHLGLARHIARRYAAGRQDDDLDQVARLALIQAVDRFDPSLGVELSTFAGRTIEGAIKRYFETTVWPVGVPRRLKLLATQLDRARGELEQRLGRSPTVAELAVELRADRDDVLEALTARATRTPSTVDPSEVAAAVGGSARSPAVEPTDAHIEQVEDGLVVEHLLAYFAGEDRRIIELRYVAGLSQQAIADEIGVSQMQVSRVLRRCVDRLRQLCS